ncbi:TetR family transcriptional regulator [Methylobacterium sp. A54F]
MADRSGRRAAVAAMKRDLILEAARAVFEAEGLDGASLRAIAARAGYTPAALYFHFDSKEAIYAEVLEDSLGALAAAVAGVSVAEADPEARLHAAAMAFFRFYAENPRDLDLGFYLFRGGLRPAGLGRARDERLNAALEAALLPIAQAAEALGAGQRAARMLTADVFAHATGLLLLLHTGRIRMFDASAADLMEAYLHLRIASLRAPPPC